MGMSARQKAFRAKQSSRQDQLWSLEAGACWGLTAGLLSLRARGCHVNVVAVGSS